MRLYDDDDEQGRFFFCGDGRPWVSSSPAPTDPYFLLPGAGDDEKDKSNKRTRCYTRSPAEVVECDIEWLSGV